MMYIGAPYIQVTKDPEPIEALKNRKIYVAF